MINDGLDYVVQRMMVPVRGRCERTMESGERKSALDDPESQLS